MPVDLDGVTWDVPRAACLDQAGDQALTRAVALDAAEQVRALVAERVSGWPTTTVALPGAEAAFLEIELLGPFAIALDAIAGSPGSIVESWRTFEQGYADDEQGWGAVTEIERRLLSWNAIADRLITAIPATCMAYFGDSGGPSALRDDLRFIDGGDLGLKGTVRVAIAEGDISFLAYARTGLHDAQVFVTAVFDPAGDDVMDSIGLEYGELTNFGESAVYLPINAETDLDPGEYVVAFEATEPIIGSGAVVRSGDPELPQALDVVIWMVTSLEFDRRALEARFRTIGDDVFGAHDISIGSITFLDPPARIVDEYSQLFLDEYGEGGQLRSLCREMSSSVGAVRAINFAIVDFLSDDDSDSIIEGSAAGLPGTALLTGSDLSCVAGMAAVDVEFFGRDLFDRAIVIWHEAGHHLGMYHTSEGDGLYFDLFADTPECRIEERDENEDGWIDLWECDGLDAENFMFYDGDGAEMTAEQAWMMRRHPLLYPAEG